MLNSTIMKTGSTEAVSSGGLAIRDSRKADARLNSRKKWGDECISAGYQIFPDVLLKCQRFMDLEAIDVVILLNITMQWWKFDELPYPRPSALARRMAVSTRTVERRIAKLQKLGLLVRRTSEEVRGKTVRKYDLSGLVKELKKYAEASLAERGWSEGVPSS
jgi:DNA-binding HxlR family transcriptional regulator